MPTLTDHELHLAAVARNERALQDSYRRRRDERRIYTLEEIASLPATRTHQDYVTRRLEPGVWVGEHVLVMEAVLATRVPPGSSVHHVNGIRHDNRPANLELWLGHHPSGQRFACPNCGWPSLDAVAPSTAPLPGKTTLGPHQGPPTPPRASEGVGTP